MLGTLTPSTEAGSSSPPSSIPTPSAPAAEEESPATTSSSSVSNTTSGGTNATEPIESTPPTPLRLCGVAGYDGRVNDVVYCPPASRKLHVNTAVIYFGGDVQVSLTVAMATSTTNLILFIKNHLGIVVCLGLP